MVASDKPLSERDGRIGQLATLPVFFDLKGKRVLVAGGSDAAAWKAELLAACGAEVHVFCPAGDLSASFRTLIDAMRHHDTNWTNGDFTDFAMAVGDCETEAEAHAFHARALSAGVPVNVIDKPEFCQFKFGSIVNRSPVVVGISTDGAAPILGQAIRRRIETLLPSSLSAWARLAVAVRGQVMDILSSSQRRTFWERFVDRAFVADQPNDETMPSLIADVDRISSGLDGKTGRVTLVGAGPGDAELLTLKAVRALQAADVILFDDLVSSEVLELARREARRMLVGKRGGRESCKQEDINEMMVRFAKAGKRVVRLKSGDPMIFGRAGEEIAFLEQHGIAVDVVPGITSASAMAARLGVSLTHRDHAQSVRFVTGHSRQGHLPEGMDWRSLADTRTTTIYYMAGRTAGEIRANLIRAGASQQTPVVVVSAIARGNERRWCGVLDDLQDALEAIGVEEPVLIGIGAVFGELQRKAVCQIISEPAIRSVALAQ
jgi:uroporphyrin-III C-methyltransferase/precorrin-2 dehydrogenase/sirohydrochlorin ferrochelatase